MMYNCTGAACRTKLNKDIRVRFPTPADAFHHYYPHGFPPVQPSSSSVDVNLDSLLADTFGKLAIADSADQLCFISSLFQKYA